MQGLRGGEGRGGEGRGGTAWHGNNRIMGLHYTTLHCKLCQVFLWPNNSVFYEWVGDKTTKDLGSFGSQLIQDFRIQT